jgi:hypothetical protein
MIDLVSGTNECEKRGDGSGATTMIDDDVDERKNTWRRETSDRRGPR